MEAFHIRCLQRILRLTWKDKVTHNEILQRTDCISIEAHIARRMLRWVCHVIRMPDERLPKQVLFSELAEGTRSAGGQKKRLKDHLKTSLKTCNIDPSQLEDLAEDRPIWQQTVKQGVLELETKRRDKREQTRAARHQRRQNPNYIGDTAHRCIPCQRSFQTRSGLKSHIRHRHERRDGRGRRRADGLPYRRTSPYKHLISRTFAYANFLQRRAERCE